MALTAQITVHGGETEIDLRGSETNREEHYAMLHALMMVQDELYGTIMKGEGYEVINKKRIKE